MVGKRGDDPHVTGEGRGAGGELWSADLGRRTKSGDRFSLGFVRKTRTQASPFHSFWVSFLIRDAEVEL